MASNETETSGAVELTDSGTSRPYHGFIARLYTGTGAFEVISRRRLWVGIWGAMGAVGMLSMLLRGFTVGIDFKGGTTVSRAPASGNGMVQTAQVCDVFRKAVG